MDRDDRRPHPGAGGLLALPPYAAPPGSSAATEPWPLPHAPVPSGTGAHLGESAAQDDASLRTPQIPGQVPPRLTRVQREPAETIGELWLELGQNIDQLRQAIDTEDVAGVDLVVLDAQGALELDYGLSCKSIAVVNYTGTTVTVVGQSGRQTQPPLVGPQVALVGAAAYLQLPFVCKALTVYGPAGGSVLVVRFASVKPVTGGLIGTPPPQSLMRTVTTNVGAGSDWSITVAALQTWRVRSITALFTTSAAVANRNPVLQIVDPGGTVQYTVNLSNGPLTATQTDQVSAAPGTPVAYQGVAPTFQTFVSIPDLVLPAGWTIRTVTAGIQAGDTWTGVAMAVEVADLTRPSPYL